MRNADKNSGPGKPTTVKGDAAREQEQLEDLTDAPSVKGIDDPTRGPRTAERDAYVKSGGSSSGSASGTSSGRGSGRKGR